MGVGIEAEKEEGKNLRHSAQVGILLTYSSLKVLEQPGNPVLIPEETRKRAVDIIAGRLWYI